ncbi:MAG: DUF488 domain-containing protein [Acidimicrobiales bacterium]
MSRHGTHVISVGYEGREVEELAADLAARGAETLIDVRLNAISRRPGFSKTALRTVLERHGIAYVHARELGNPKENRHEFRHGSRRAITTYERVLDSRREQLVGLLAELRGRTTAVLCYEADHAQCHRRMVIDRLGEMVPGLTSSKAGE